MRNLSKNKTTLYYSLYSDEVIPTYETDSDGEIIYDDDGYPIETGSEEKGYSELVEFEGNIAFVSGEAEATAYGISVDGYDSKLVVAKGELPIDETSLIFESEVDTVSEKTADFRVVKVQPSLNEMAYLLKRVEK